MAAIAVPRTTQNVLAVAAGAAFLALLDTTVANLAVADVQTDFAGTSVHGASWIITIYAVVFAALLAPAAMIPASLAVVLADTPPERRAKAIGAWSAAGALAAAAGPALGGVLVDQIGWRALFVIN